MKEALRELLHCPRCGGAPLSNADGDLGCPAGHRFPVVRGIPRLVNEARLRAGQRDTADAFGYSWSHYPKENPYTEEQWRDWVVPLREADFESRLVLDAGCGLGGLAEYARKWGARQVVGVDLSAAIDAARDRLGDDVDLVYGDLHHLPFNPGTFDVAYSIGVLHHLPDPECGFASVARAVRPGGLMFAWVYGRENNGWIVHFVDPLRQNVSRRLPHWAVKWLISWPAAALLWPLVQLSRRRPRMPYRSYLRWLATRDFEFVHGVVFDHLVAPTSHYIRREEFEQWFLRAGLVDVRITWRNENSWRGVGRVPGVADPAEAGATTSLAGG